MQKIQEDQKVLLGRHIRSLRKAKGWTQEELGNYADIDYKFVGSIERGQQNPSFETLVKIAAALKVDLPELFRFEQETINKNTIEERIGRIVKALPEDNLRRLFVVLRDLYPTF